MGSTPRRSTYIALQAYRTGVGPIPPDGSSVGIPGSLASVRSPLRQRSCHGSPSLPGAFYAARAARTHHAARKVRRPAGRRAAVNRYQLLTVGRQTAPGRSAPRRRSMSWHHYGEVMGYERRRPAAPRRSGTGAGSWCLPARHATPGAPRARGRSGRGAGYIYPMSARRREAVSRTGHRSSAPHPTVDGASLLRRPPAAAPAHSLPR